MLQEFIKSISIVLYEALCSHIFLGAILQDKITSRIKKTIAVLALAAVFMGCALSTQILDQYFLRRRRFLWIDGMCRLFVLDFY